MYRTTTGFIVICTVLFCSVAAANSFSTYLDAQCDDATTMRGCGHYQTMFTKLNSRADQLAQRDQTFITTFIQYSEDRLARSDDPLDRFRVAYVGHKLTAQQQAGHGISSAEEEQLFSELFAGLGVNLGGSRSSRTSSQSTYEPRQTTQRSSRSGSIIGALKGRTVVDSQSTRSRERTTVRPRGQSVQSSSRAPGAIRTVSAPSTSVRVRRGEIITDSSLIELLVRATLPNRQSIGAEQGYVLVALPRRGGHAGQPITLSYSAGDQNWYLSTSLRPNSFDRLRLYLLCRDCAGSNFGFEGAFSSRAVVDSVDYAIRSVTYRERRERTPIPGDYLRSQGKSFALESIDARLKYKTQREIEMTVTIKNDSLIDAVLRTSDISYTLTVQPTRLAEEQYRILSEQLDCDDGRGRRVYMSPLSTCTLKVLFDLDRDVPGGGIRIEAEHTDTYTRNNKIYVYTSLPQLADKR